MTSTLIVGWLGFGAHQAERATVRLAMLPAQDGAQMRIVPVHQVVADARPPAPPSASTSVGEGENVRRDLDVGPSHIHTTVVGALHRVMQGAGRPQWSHERLQGVLGHAFSFVMRNGDGAVWQEAFVDYGGQATFLDMLPELGYRFQRFEATGTDEDLKAVRAKAWAAVRASIDRGVPAMAASPMSLEQEADGLRAQIWGLLVGYDESDETYTVRHQYVDQGRKAFTVRYDALGQIEQWFCVLVCDTAEPLDDTGVHIRALRNAVALANGTRFGPDDIAYRVDATGFDAYELWREAQDADVATPERARRHAWELHIAREHAVAYLQELVDVYPTVSDVLGEAIAAYGREVETTQKIQEVCRVAEKAGEYSGQARAKVQELISASLDAERDAIASLAAAVAVMAVSQ